jgi:hypothetical protein
VKVEVTVTSERPKRSVQYIHSNVETEKYVSAVVDVEGEPRLIADALRALADSIWLPESIEYREAVNG